MMNLRTNMLMTTAVVLLVSYWSLGFILPGYWFASFGSASLAVAGAAVFFSSTSEAYTVLRRGVIGPAELAVLGICGLGFGAFYSGVWGICWTVAGFPPNWTATPYSSFGRYVMAISFFLVFLSPEATVQGIRPPRWWIIVLWFLAVAAIMAVVGLQVQIERTVPETIIIQEGTGVR